MQQRFLDRSELRCKRFAFRLVVPRGDTYETSAGTLFVVEEIGTLRASSRS